MAVLGSFDAAYQGSMLLVRGVVIHLSPASMDALRTFVEQAQRFHWPGLLLLAWTSRRIFAVALLGAGDGLRRARPQLRQAQPGGALAW